MPVRGFSPCQARIALSSPSSPARRATVAASAADCARKPWSTVRTLMRGPSGTVLLQALASTMRAVESEPPDTARAIRPAPRTAPKISFRSASEIAADGPSAACTLALHLSTLLGFGGFGELVTDLR